MFKQNRYANVTSTIALVVALCGTSAYASAKLTSHDIGDGQVKHIDLANNAVTSAKVNNRTLLARDFRKGQLRNGQGVPGPEGDRGPKGDTGPAGGTGPRGPGGPALLDVLPSGQTLRGAYGLSGFRSGLNPPLANDSGPADGQISFPIPLAAPPAVVVIKRKQPQNEEGDPTTQCPGSVLNPQAAPGYLCIYESRNADNVNLQEFSPYDGAYNVATRFGAGLFITASQDPNSTHRTSKGSWAVTAP